MGHDETTGFYFKVVPPQSGRLFELVVSINKKLRPRSAAFLNIKKSLYWTIGNNYGCEATKAFQLFGQPRSQSIFFQNQNYFPISDGCSRRMFLGQTEYKERRLLRNLLKIETAQQKLKRLFFLQQIMGLCWQLGTTAAKRRTPSRTIWQKTTAKRPPL